MAGMIKAGILVLLATFVIGLIVAPSTGASAEIVPVEEYYALPWEVVNIQLALNTTEPLGAVHLRVNYDPTVCNITSVTQQNGFDVLVANTEHSSEGWIEFIGYQTGAAGAGNTTFVFSTQAVGDYCTRTWLNTTVITMKNNTGSPMSYNITNATFRIALKGDYSGDMDVDAWDSCYLARYLVGLSGYEEVCSGEVSGDGVLDAYDCLYLARKLLGLV